MFLFSNSKVQIVHENVQLGCRTKASRLDGHVKSFVSCTIVMAIIKPSFDACACEGNKCAPSFAFTVLITMIGGQHSAQRFDYFHLQTLPTATPNI